MEKARIRPKVGDRQKKKFGEGNRRRGFRIETVPISNGKSVPIWKGNGSQHKGGPVVLEFGGYQIGLFPQMNYLSGEHTLKETLWVKSEFLQV